MIFDEERIIGWKFGEKLRNLTRFLMFTVPYPSIA